MTHWRWGRQAPLQARVPHSKLLGMQAMLFGVLLLVLLLWALRGAFRKPPSSSVEEDERGAKDAPGEEEDYPDPDGEPVLLEISDSIDLHHFAPRDVLNVVCDYLEEAVERGYAEVRIIHGKGKGVQRARVQKLLSTHPLVERYRDAPAGRGGLGATLAWLVKPGRRCPTR